VRELEKALGAAMDERKCLLAETQGQRVHARSLQAALAAANQEIETTQHEGERLCLELAQALSTEQGVGALCTARVAELEFALSNAQDECSRLQHTQATHAEQLRAEQLVVETLRHTAAKAMQLQHEGEHVLRTRDELHSSNSKLITDNKQLQQQLALARQQLDFAAERERAALAALADARLATGAIECRSIVAKLSQYCCSICLDIYIYTQYMYTRRRVKAARTRCC